MTDQPIAKPRRPETIEEFCAQTLARHITKLADDLRHAADDVARHANQLDRVGNPGIPSYAVIASNVQQELMRLLGNTHLGSLTTAAQDADQARTKRLAAEAIAAQIDATIGGYPDNDVERPKIERGDHANDATWAALIAREYAAKEG